MENTKNGTKSADYIFGEIYRLQIGGECVKL